MESEGKFHCDTEHRFLCVKAVDTQYRSQREFPDTVVLLVP